MEREISNVFQINEFDNFSHSKCDPSSINNMHYQSTYKGKWKGWLMIREIWNEFQQLWVISSLLHSSSFCFDETTTDCMWFMFKFKVQRNYATRNELSLAQKRQPIQLSNFYLLRISKTFSILILILMFSQKVRIQLRAKLIWMKNWNESVLMSRKVSLIRNITIIPAVGPWDLFCFHLFPVKITASLRHNITKNEVKRSRGTSTSGLF